MQTKQVNSNNIRNLIITIAVVDVIIIIGNIIVTNIDVSQTQNVDYVTNEKISFQEAGNEVPWEAWVENQREINGDDVTNELLGLNESLSYIYINSQGWTYELYTNGGIILRDAAGQTIAEDVNAYVNEDEEDPDYDKIMSSVLAISEINNQNDWTLLRAGDFD
jgi:hypothetical protein